MSASAWPSPLRQAAELLDEAAAVHLAAGRTRLAASHRARAAALLDQDAMTVHLDGR